MPQFLRYPKVQLSTLLFLIFLSAWWQYSNITTVYLLLGSLAFCIISDLLLTFIRKRIWFIPFGAIATGLIISLIVDTNAGLIELAAICTLAMASKNFLRVSNVQIFNPAGFGLMVGGLLFGLPVSWWGVSFQSLQSFSPFLILILPVLISAYRMRKYASILAFLFAYSLIIRSPLILLDPTTLFFALVMLPEPMSSPVKITRQLLYGALVGILAYLLSSGPFAQILPDSLIPALLVGNLIFLKFR